MKVYIYIYIYVFFIYQVIFHIILQTFSFFPFLLNLKFNSIDELHWNWESWQRRIFSLERSNHQQWESKASWTGYLCMIMPVTFWFPPVKFDWFPRVQIRLHIDSLDDHYTTFHELPSSTLPFCPSSRPAPLIHPDQTWTRRERSLCCLNRPKVSLFLFLIFFCFTQLAPYIKSNEK